MSTTDDAPTTELVSAAVGDRCGNCQTPLASDQRYCVNCGERRGKARFSFDTLNAQQAPAETPKKPSRKPRISSTVAFVASIATLLLALGVGVLIGHTNNNTKTTAAAAPSQVIKIEGGGGGSGGGSTKSASKKAIKSEFKAPVIPKLTKKAVKQVNQAATDTLGTGEKNLSQNPTQQVGGSCSGGVGCQGGKFTGNYFGQ
jgi:hypothetical protein